MPKRKLRGCNDAISSLLALSLPLSARIGEKYEDFEKRMGKCWRVATFTSNDETSFVANHKGSTIFVWKGVISGEIHDVKDTEDAIRVLNLTRPLTQATKTKVREGVTKFTWKGLQAYHIFTYPSAQRVELYTDSEYTRQMEGYRKMAESEQ